MKEKKQEIDKLVQKLDKMIKEGSPKEETEEVIKELQKLLREYLGE